MLQMINHVRIEDNVAYVKDHGYLKAEMVARMHTDEGCSIETVMEHYQLTAAEVHACLTYYYDNQTVLDAEEASVRAEVKANAIKGSEHLEKLRARQKPD